MKIYLAASYGLKYYLRLVRDRLEDMGHEVTSRWLDEEEALNVQIGDVDDYLLNRYADEDEEDIMESDAVVHFQQKSMPNVRGGAIAEFGIVRGLNLMGANKQRIIVGDIVNLFDMRPDVIAFETLEEFFEWAETEADYADTQGFCSAADAIHRSGYVRVEAKYMAGDYKVNDFEDTQRAAMTPTCWCGKKLEVHGMPDFPGDEPEEYCTMHYKCPLHGEYYMEPQGVLLSGKAASGKSIVCKMLVEELGEPWHEEAIAGALKVEWFKVNRAQRFAMGEYSNIITEVNKLKVEDPTCRPGLIELGKMRREQDPDYWIKQLPLGQGAIVSDCRFENELNLLRKQGFMAVRIEANEEVRTERGWPSIDDTSETELDGRMDWDYVIENNGGLERLRLEVKNVAQEVREAQGSI